MRAFASFVTIACLSALCLGGSPPAARAQATPSAALDELRRSFTLDGKPVPPLLFRDMGDGDLADAKPILVTADVRAAVGSNQYGRPIAVLRGWTSQTEDPSADGSADTYAYRYVGTTPDNLLVVETRASSSDGTGVFTTLHVLDASIASAFDDGGQRYERVDLTTLQGYPLGDRWSGEVTLSGDVATIKTDDRNLGNQTKADLAIRTLRIVRP